MTYPLLIYYVIKIQRCSDVFKMRFKVIVFPWTQLHQRIVNPFKHLFVIEFG